jgi:indoleamine 2,3-dioxygenase
MSHAVSKTLMSVSSFLGTPQTGDTIPFLYPVFNPWWDLSAHIGHDLRRGVFHGEVDRLPAYRGKLKGIPDEALWRLFVSVSFMVQAYIWGDPGFPKAPRTRLPKGLAVLAYKLGKHFGVRPLLVYATYALYNWRMIDCDKSITPENISMLVHFNERESSVGVSPSEAYIAEDWFVAIHIAIEHEALYALRHMRSAEIARQAGTTEILEYDLRNIRISINRMTGILERMNEWCAPDTYFRHVRPYLSGFTPRLIPSGVVYEGVRAYGGSPQFFDGQTGAQSSIMPALDRFLGIEHTSPQLSDHLGRMLEFHTPRPHRRYVKAWSAKSRHASTSQSFEAIEGRSSAIQNELALLRLAMAEFRAAHYTLAITHIARPAHAMLGVTRPTGTGGSDLIPSLMRHLEETLHPSMRESMSKQFHEAFRELLGRPVL